MRHRVSLVELRAAGYRVARYSFVDLFPETQHAESCVLLERVSNRKADSYVKLNVKMADYYRIKDSAETENAEE
jgi:23S rRNA (uracil1939-C5)-methyltransferase